MPDITQIDFKTGKVTERDYTPEELVEIQARIVKHAQENPPRTPGPNEMTLEQLAKEVAGVKTVLKAKNVATAEEFDAATTSIKGELDVVVPI